MRSAQPRLLVVTGLDIASRIAGKAVKFNGKLIDEALVRRARRLAAESGDYLFEKAGMAISAELRGRKSSAANNNQ